MKNRKLAFYIHPFLYQIKNRIDIFLSHEWPSEIYNYGNTRELLRIKPYFKDEVNNNQLGSKPLAELMDNLRPKNWYSAHLHVGFDAIKTFSDGTSTKFVALDKCIANRDFLRVFTFISLYCLVMFQIVDISPENSKPGPPQLEYDSEWISILKESEPFLNFRRDYWNIPKEFFQVNDSLRKATVAQISTESMLIPLPKDKHQLGLNHTKIFKNQFLNYASIPESTKFSNPEEISLDI